VTKRETYFQTLRLQIKDKWQTIRDLQVGYFLFGNLTQMHQKTTDSILAAGNQDTLTRFDGFRRDAFSEERNCPVHAVFQRLVLREFAVQHNL